SDGGILRISERAPLVGYRLEVLPRVIDGRDGLGNLHRGRYEGLQSRTESGDLVRPRLGQSILCAQKRLIAAYRAHPEHHQKEPEQARRRRQELPDAVRMPAQRGDFHAETVLLLSVEVDQILERLVGARCSRRESGSQTEDRGVLLSCLEMTEERRDLPLDAV